MRRRRAIESELEPCSPRDAAVLELLPSHGSGASLNSICCHAVFLSSRLMSLPHYVEPQAAKVVNRRLMRNLVQFAFLTLQSHANAQTQQRQRVQRLQRVTWLRMCRRTLSALAVQTHLRQHRRKRTVELYVKITYRSLAFWLAVWIQQRRFNHLHRRRMLGLRWAISNSKLAGLMGEWNFVAARASRCRRLSSRNAAKQAQAFKRRIFALLKYVLLRQRRLVRRYTVFSARRAEHLLQSATTIWAVIARQHRLLLCLQDRATGRYLTGLSGEIQPFVSWCQVSCLKEWHAVVRYRRSRALLAQRCCSRILRRRLQVITTAWSELLDEVIAGAQRDEFIERKVQARISLRCLREGYCVLVAHAVCRRRRRHLSEVVGRSVARGMVTKSIVAWNMMLEITRGKQKKMAMVKRHASHRLIGSAFSSWAHFVNVLDKLASLHRRVVSRHHRSLSESAVTGWRWCIYLGMCAPGGVYGGSQLQRRVERRFADDAFQHWRYCVLSLQAVRRRLVTLLNTTAMRRLASSITAWSALAGRHKILDHCFHVVHYRRQQHDWRWLQANFLSWRQAQQIQSHWRKFEVALITWSKNQTQTAVTVLSRRGRVVVATGARRHLRKTVVFEAWWLRTQLARRVANRYLAVALRHHRLCAVQAFHAWWYCTHRQRIIARRSLQILAARAEAVQHQALKDWLKQHRRRSQIVSRVSRRVECLQRAHLETSVITWRQVAVFLRRQTNGMAALVLRHHTGLLRQSLNALKNCDSQSQLRCLALRCQGTSLRLALHHWRYWHLLFLRYRHLHFRLQRVHASRALAACVHGWVARRQRENDLRVSLIRLLRRIVQRLAKAHYVHWFSHAMHAVRLRAMLHRIAVHRDRILAHRLLRNWLNVKRYRGRIVHHSETRWRLALNALVQGVFSEYRFKAFQLSRRRQQIVRGMMRRNRLKVLTSYALWRRIVCERRAYKSAHASFHEHETPNILSAETKGFDKGLDWIGGGGEVYISNTPRRGP